VAVTDELPPLVEGDPVVEGEPTVEGDPVVEGKPAVAGDPVVVGSGADKPGGAAPLVTLAPAAVDAPFVTLGRVGAVVVWVPAIEGCAFVRPDVVEVETNGVFTMGTPMVTVPGSAPLWVGIPAAGVVVVDVVVLPDGDVVVVEVVVADVVMVVTFDGLTTLVGSGVDGVLLTWGMVPLALAGATLDGAAAVAPPLEVGRFVLWAGGAPVGALTVPGLAVSGQGGQSVPPGAGELAGAPVGPPVEVLGTKVPCGKPSSSLGLRF
jgi:hypothetical protein